MNMKKTVEIQFEKVEVKQGIRKLEGNWTVEIDPEPIIMYYYPTLWERIWNRILNIFGKGRKNWIYDELSNEILKYDNNRTTETP
jgi:hypothetical protein